MPDSADERLRITPVVSAADVAVVKLLIAEYAEALGIDLGFQGFEQELVTFPGDYAPPRGRLFLVTWGSPPVGCVGVWPLSASTGALKRLYVRPSGRGRGVGRALTLAAMSAALELGYERLRLDTLPSMQAALSLYTSLGFRVIPPYRKNPVPGAQFLECILREKA